MKMLLLTVALCSTACLDKPTRVEVVDRHYCEVACDGTAVAFKPGFVVLTYENGAQIIVKKGRMGGAYISEVCQCLPDGANTIVLPDSKE